MTTLAKHIIVAGAENHPPMLEKSMYDSWASRIRLFIKGNKNGRMMLDSIDNGPLVYPTVEENRQTRPKKYFKLTEAQQLQDDYDVQATNIILHDLPHDVYALVNHQEAAKDVWDRGETLYEYYWRFSQLINDMHTIGMAMQQVQVNTKFLNALPLEWSKFVTNVKLAKRDDPIECINKAMAFLSDVASRQTQSFAGTRNRGISTTLKGNNAAGQAKTIPQNSAFHTEDLDAYDSDCDGISSAKAFLIENLSSYDHDVLSEVPYSDSYPNDMINQDVQEMPYSEQTHIDDYPDNKINYDSNIIPYSQYFAIVKEHDVIYVIDDEETLILEEESRSKMLDKQNDPILIKQKISISPIDYSKLNKIKEDFGKHFVTKKELSAEQAFWLKHSNYNTDTSVKSHTPVRIEAPSELPRVSLVNESLKKLKYQLASFDKVMKKRTSSDAITADEITEVQTVFNQMEAAVDQCSVDKTAFEIQIKQLSIDNDQLLKQIMSQEIVHIAVNSVDILDVKKSCVNECNKCLELETKLIKKKDLIEKDVYDKLLKSYSTLEKQDIDEIEMINIELEHSVAKLLSENENLRKEREHLKSIYKDQFDSIRKTHVQSKEQCNSLISQINAKSVENSDLNAQLQEKVFAIAALKNELRKLKGNNVVDTAVSKPSATIAPGMFKLDIEPVSRRLKNNRDAHDVYLEKTIENTDTLRGLVECARKQNPSEPLLESACMFIKHVQELLVYVSKTCPSLTKRCEKLVVVTPMNKDKKVSASRSKPSGNTKNNRITRPPSSNQKNKVEEHHRKVKSSLNKMSSVFEHISNAHVKHSVRNAKVESICAICNKFLFDANHDMCIIDYVNDVNVRSKSKSKRNKIRKVWKPTGKVFSEIGYSWKPTGRTFTIVGNKCPLTRITSTKVVPTKENSTKSVATPTQGILVYSKRPKATRSVGFSSKVKIV
ncbi:hypothetical protein Tco_0543951 [Tanacetum coccineum]